MGMNFIPYSPPPVAANQLEIQSEHCVFSSVMFWNGRDESAIITSMSDISRFENRELGLVAWHRTFETAKAEAQKASKPIFLLFQEVPGCATCVNFGSGVLGNPLLAALIQDQFVPLAIFNNRQGHDAAILKRFGEPSWNNPVVYLLGQNEERLTKRLADCYDGLTLYDAITKVLQRLLKPLPAYADVLRNDLVVESGLSKTLYFTTPCFWSGETSLAQHDAVFTTEAGWVDGEEVVQVSCDPNPSHIRSLTEFAQNEGFAPINGHHFERDDVPQYYLSKTPYARLPLTRGQRTKINLAIPYRNRPEQFLSPPQQEWLTRRDIAEKLPPTTYQRDPKELWARLLKLGTAER
jgi:hypothetical protein